ncbi:MAG: sulfatase [Pirellulales bacterium]|nr:sulfatase [Pirellulales bacterium]
MPRQIRRKSSSLRRAHQHARCVVGRAAWVLLPALVLACVVDAAETDAERPDGYNVLFIAVDDMRPELGCYGFEYMHTPNIDRLASRGTLFNRAYCQQAVCNPSRASLMTGLRPDSTKVHDLRRHFRLGVPDVVTVAQHFKNHGYHSQAISKIYHRGLDDRQSWSVPQVRPNAPTYISDEILGRIAETRKELENKGIRTTRSPGRKDPATGSTLELGSRKGPRVHGPSWEAPDVADNVLCDGKTADRIVELLRRFKEEDTPFFLGCGFLKPHLPFVAPKRYFDLYPIESIKLPDNRFHPKNAPQLALHQSGEFRAYSDVPAEGPFPEPLLRDTLRAYRACVSYVDAQVGRILAELDRLGLRNNTVVVLWGDHGWHLGEQDLWGKMTNFEIATRVPMIISAPGQSNTGARTDGLTEFVDIYPTLCELCGLPVPDRLEGTSLVPLMNDPGQKWKAAAFSQYPRPGHYPAEDHIRQMGYSMRTDRYRYTEWRDHKTGEVLARELYDYETDPQGNDNVAGEAGYATLVERLGRQLAAGWRGALPRE